MSQETKPEHEHRNQREPYRVRLPGFLINEDVGLGDVIRRATSNAGIKPCGGCAGRATRLNRLIVLTRRP